MIGQLVDIAGGQNYTDNLLSEARAIFCLVKDRILQFQQGNDQMSLEHVNVSQPCIVCFQALCTGFQQTGQIFIRHQFFEQLCEQHEDEFSCPLFQTQRKQPGRKLRKQQDKEGLFTGKARILRERQHVFLQAKVGTFQ